MFDSTRIPGLLYGALRKAGIDRRIHPDLPLLTVHDLRHTAATNMLENYSWDVYN